MLSSFAYETLFSYKTIFEGICDVSCNFKTLQPALVIVFKCFFNYEMVQNALTIVIYDEGL